MEEQGQGTKVYSRKSEVNIYMLLIVSALTILQFYILPQKIVFFLIIPLVIKYVLSQLYLSTVVIVTPESIIIKPRSIIARLSPVNVGWEYSLSEIRSVGIRERLPWSLNRYDTIHLIIHFKNGKQEKHGLGHLHQSTCVELLNDLESRGIEVFATPSKAFID